jgi:sugar/nucleoside kinase (ribokinase family)
MYDLICIGSISVDLYYQGDSLTNDGERFNLAIGGKYQVNHFHAGLGGGAANVAIGVQSDGYKTAVWGKIGENQFKELILTHLKTHGIPSTLCEMEEGYTKISTILLSPTGERTIIHYETPHEHIIKRAQDLKKLDGAKFVYLSNLWRVPLEERKEILSYACSQKMITIMNLGIADCRRSTEQLESLLHHTNILILNTHEFAEMVKKPIKDINFRKDITHYFPSLKDKIVAITDGSQGSYAFVNGVVLYEPAVKVSKIADTTGAGDAFSAGFISGFLEKSEVEHALHRGNKYGARVVQKIGAN